MFTVFQSDYGNVPSNEYHPAKAGTYKAGQVLNVVVGLLVAITANLPTIPAYLCMAERKVAEDGDLLAVTRVSDDYIYETSLSAAAASAVFGSKLQVAAGGLQVLAGDGSFEVVSLDGTAAGDAVRGRFVVSAAAAEGGEKK